LLQGRLWCGTQDSALRESFTFWLARVYRLNCQWALATKTLKGLIAMNRGLNLVPQEVRARSELALIHAQTNKPKAARKELNSCRQLMGAEDWRGLSGLVARANGSALAAEGKIRRARLEFERAIDILFDYHLPWEHAEALTCWGWSLCNAGDDSGREKLRAARSIYKHYGAGNPWIERVVDDRWRKEFHTSSGDAHSSVDADPATVSTSFNRRTTAKGVGPARSAEGDAAFAKAADLRLLTAATHDAISHLMYAINKASGLRRPIEHMADSLDRISRNLFRTKGEFTTPYRLLRPGPQSNGRSK